jgi:hypothetical protein
MATRIPASQRTREGLTALIEGPSFHSLGKGRAGETGKHFFDTSSWGAFCDVTLTLKQARQPDSGGWVKIDDYRCRQAFRHFMNLLNSIWSGISSIRQKASCITRT